MVRLHIAHLQSDIKHYEVALQDEVDRKGGQKKQKVDRKSGQKTRDAIIALISSNPHITTTQMSVSLGINRSALSKHIKRMQEDGIIRRVGPDKGGFWEVIGD